MMYQLSALQFPAKPVICFLALLLVSFFAKNAQAVYPSPIVYKQTNTIILEPDDVMWSGVPNETYVNFANILASEDGTRIMFNVACGYCPSGAGFLNRPFVADSDGQNVTDISDLFPADLVSSWSGWGNMRLNADGSRAFIRAQRSGGEQSLYYKNLTSGTNHKALIDDGHKSFWINKDGVRLYLGAYDEGYDSGLGRHRRGLYWGNLGGSRSWYLDIHDLPCNQQCDNLNMLGYMGNSTEDDHTFFVWNSGEAGNICAGDDCNHNALWHSKLDGNAVRVTNAEHYWVDQDIGGWRGISTTKGETVLYSYKHRYGDPQKLVTVDRSTGVERELTWTSSLNGFEEAFVTPSGRYAFVRGTMGSAGGLHRQTLFDLPNDTTRDTWSYYLRSGLRYISNLAQDRYYFMAFNKSPSIVYRIDTQAHNQGDFSKASNINSITFSEPALWDDDSTIKVSVAVSDAQGLDNIERVRLSVLVEGMEDTYWSMPRVPLAFPTGDSGSTRLYDDGTHGDSVAGDGIFTFDALATRKDGRTINGFNSWYAHYSLPNDIGIRIIAEDTDGNSTIADTRLTIVDCSTDVKTYTGEISDNTLACTTREVSFLTGAVIKSGATVQLKTGTASFQRDTRVEKGAILGVSTS